MISSNPGRAIPSRIAPSTPAITTIRCAIYTRKSSDEGLGQEFNSLEAQRASGEACILSHRSEGWVCLPDRYDDGGFSGGSMDRPALKRLLADINNGRVDRVIVYKLDRLTRSIKDFAAIIEVFDKHGVSFVSVTQAFDTGTSMGRLMVHVLMSFAQFERELASERTRDKIALQRQRGQWAGGRPVLGYDLVAGKLLVNDAEASRVRRIFTLYLENDQSFATIIVALQRDGVTTKCWTSKEGKPMGGSRISKSGLSLLLSNPLYLGQVPHKDKVYPGQHKAIVDAATFQRVQEKLAEGRSCGASQRQNKYHGLLKGLLQCRDCQAPMIHDSTRKPNGSAYRYYTCRHRNQLERGRCNTKPLPAEQIERFVIDKVRSAFAEPILVNTVFDVVRKKVTDQVRILQCSRRSAEADAKGMRTRVHTTGDAMAATLLADAERKITAIDAQLQALESSHVDRATVERGLREFEPLWATLAPRERHELLATVIKRIVYDGRAGELTVEPADIKPAGAQS